MSAVQLIAIVFGLAMAYASYLGFRRQQFGRAGLILWEVIWIGLVVVSLVPQVFRPLAQPLHVARLLDLVVIGGMLALGTFTYRTYAAVQEMRRQLEQMIRAEALAGLSHDQAEEERRPTA